MGLPADLSARRDHRLAAEIPAFVNLLGNYTDDDPPPETGKHKSKKR